MRKSLLLLLPMLLLTACGGVGSTDAADNRTILDNQAEIPSVTETAAKPEIPEGAIADESGDFVFTGKLQQVGDDENGYIQVPLGYVPFQEEGVEGLTQYSDVTGTNIFTLEHYAGLSYQTAAENMRAYIQQDETLEDVQGATVQIAGNPALQLYGRYSDGIFIVIWFIEDPADTSSSYYLAIEFDAEHTDIVACSSTFQTVDAFHASETGAAS